MRLRYGTSKSLGPAIEGLMPLGMAIPLITRMEAQKTLWRLWQDPFIRRKLRWALEKVPKPVLEGIEKVGIFGEGILKNYRYLEDKGVRGAYFFRPLKESAISALPEEARAFQRALQKGPVIGLAKHPWFTAPETIFHEFGHHIHDHYLKPSEIRMLTKSFHLMPISSLEKATQTVLNTPEEVFAQAVGEYFYDRGLFEKFPRAVREVVKKSIKRIMK